MSDYLLTISIGPVQGFIAAARKTRDLWYGSQLLSEIIRNISKQLPAICARHGGEVTLIYPSLTARDSDIPLPNKLLVSIRTPFKTGQPARGDR